MWLKAGGYLIIHLVDKEMFDPILPPANPLLLLTPQRYAEKRITTSIVNFDKFKYKSDFVTNPTSSQVKFVEKFENHGKVFRKHEHTIYMEDENTITDIAISRGFILQGKIDLIKVGYEYQTLYILFKPS